MVSTYPTDRGWRNTGRADPTKLAGGGGVGLTFRSPVPRTAANQGLRIPRAANDRTAWPRYMRALRSALRRATAFGIGGSLASIPIPVSSPGPGELATPVGANKYRDVPHVPHADGFGGGLANSYNPAVYRWDQRAGWPNYPATGESVLTITETNFQTVWLPTLVGNPRPVGAPAARYLSYLEQDNRNGGLGQNRWMYRRVGWDLGASWASETLSWQSATAAYPQGIGSAAAQVGWDPWGLPVGGFAPLPIELPFALTRGVFRNPDANGEPGRTPVGNPLVDSAWAVEVWPRTANATSPVGRVPPGRGEREKKVRFAPPWLAIPLRAALFATEAIDFIEAIWKAIPKHLRMGRKTTPQDMLSDIYNHWHHIQWTDALLNLVYNELEDRVIGKVAGTASKARSPWNKNRQLTSGPALF